MKVVASGEPASIENLDIPTTHFLFPTVTFKKIAHSAIEKAIYHIQGYTKIHVIACGSRSSRAETSLAG